MMDRSLPPLSLIADDCGAMPAPFSLRWIDCFYKFVALSFNIFKRSSHELMLAFHAGIINVADFESKEPKAFVVRLPSHTVPFCCWRIKYGFTVSSSSQVHKTPVRPSFLPSFLGPLVYHLGKQLHDGHGPTDGVMFCASCMHVLLLFHVPAKILPILFSCTPTDVQGKKLVSCGPHHFQGREVIWCRGCAMSSTEFPPTAEGAV